VSLDLPELATTDLDGPVRYREWDGPDETTFVLVHGLAGSHNNWVQVAPGLAGLGRVLALDLPGFGRSPRAGRGCGLMDERRVLSRFVGELATGRVVICGNSMGGVIGILHAAVEPSTVAGLVLTGSALPRAGGAFPHPVVVGAFALYDVPWLGERLVRTRTRLLSPERTVRLGSEPVPTNFSSSLSRAHLNVEEPVLRIRTGRGPLAAAAGPVSVPDMSVPSWALGQQFSHPHNGLSFY